jgi:thiol-disulfide isomerase/thioredoxin
MDGGAIDLEELRGKVVVLDFWATWCPPCRKALPRLHEVARWVREEALPVEIVTINVWEVTDPAQDTPDKRLENVRAFWTRNEYSLPVAMDYTDATAMAYGVRGIPATFVLRSDLVVHGQPRADVETLKASIREALDALEAPDDDAPDTPDAPEAPEDPDAPAAE